MIANVISSRGVFILLFLMEAGCSFIKPNSYDYKKMINTKNDSIEISSFCHKLTDKELEDYRKMDLFLNTEKVYELHVQALSKDTLKPLSFLLIVQLKTGEKYEQKVDLSSKNKYKSNFVYTNLKTKNIKYKISIRPIDSLSKKE